MLEAVQLALAVVEHPDPRRESGQAGLCGYPPSEPAGPLHQHHRVSPLPQRHRGLEARRTAAHHEHRLVGMAGPVDLRVPPSPPLLAHRGVLGAADGRHREIARDADVAADALSDLIGPSLGDLGRQEWVGDGGAGCSDEVDHSLAHHSGHGVGRSEPPDAHHRLGGERLEAGHVLLLAALFSEAGGDAVVLPASHHEVPQVGDLAQLAEHGLDVSPADAGVSDELLRRDPTPHRGGAVHLLNGVDQELAQQAHPVLNAAPVGIGALVVAGREEMVNGAEGVAAVDIDEVESGIQRPPHGLPVPAAQVGDVAKRHGPGLNRVVGESGDRQIGGAHGRGARCEVGAVHAVVGQLDSGQRPVVVDALGHHRQRGDVGVVPQADLYERRYLRRVVDFGLLGTHHRPPALGLHRPHLGVSLHVAVSHAIAVGHLEEAVSGDHRAEGHLLQQHAVGIVGHL